MKPKTGRPLAALLCISSLAWNPPALASESVAFVAGLTPYQRPAAAPTLTAPALPDRGKALRGVSEPIPPTLKFLDDQGNWYNPFSLPGMTGPYDLRGWHAVSKEPKQ